MTRDASTAVHARASAVGETEKGQHRSRCGAVLIPGSKRQEICMTYVDNSLGIRANTLVCSRLHVKLLETGLALRAAGSHNTGETGKTGEVFAAVVDIPARRSRRGLPCSRSCRSTPPPAGTSGCPEGRRRSSSGTCLQRKTPFSDVGRPHGGACGKTRYWGCPGDIGHRIRKKRFRNIRKIDEFL